MLTNCSRTKRNLLQCLCPPQIALLFPWASVVTSRLLTVWVMALPNAQHTDSAECLCKELNFMYKTPVVQRYPFLPPFLSLSGVVTRRS